MACAWSPMISCARWRLRVWSCMVLVLVFASVFSSPDDKPLTMQSVAQSDPVGFVTVSLSELAGNSVIAQYGPPYNNGTGSVQFIGPFSPQQLAGVSLPIDTAAVYVLDPLKTVQNPAVAAAVHTFTAASASQQATWENNYATALGNADGSLDANGHLNVAAGDLWTLAGDVWGVARYRAQRRARRPLAHRRQILPDGLYQAAAVPERGCAAHTCRAN